MSGFPKTLWVIEDWSVTSRDSVYTPPECRTTSIQGRCPHRRGFEHAILTSAVRRVEGRRIFTENGSRYVLGRPDPKYVAQCRSKGWHVPTHKHPLVVVKPSTNNGRRRDSKGRFLPKR